MQYVKRIAYWECPSLTPTWRLLVDGVQGQGVLAQQCTSAGDRFLVLQASVLYRDRHRSGQGRPGSGYPATECTGPGATRAVPFATVPWADRLYAALWYSLLPILGMFPSVYLSVVGTNPACS
eukprot:3544377-Rhodomonas_salina.1